MERHALYLDVQRKAIVRANLFAKQFKVRYSYRPGHRICEQVAPIKLSILMALIDRRLGDSEFQFIPSAAVYKLSIDRSSPFEALSSNLGCGMFSE
ncbi:hypothetical protein [Pseudomonas sp. D3-10]|uniref:hypothetical protein n=1 Tax=Pseudomonas sp. D3-10 TaxID=2817392 RepID=UPI003DAA49CB